MGNNIIGLYYKATKVKRSYYGNRTRRNTSNSRQIYKVGILYSIYRGNNGRKICGDLY